MPWFAPCDLPGPPQEREEMGRYTKKRLAAL